MDTLQLLAPALVAGVMVLLMHVPLGFQVLRRQIIFIDLAIAQIAACGVLWAQHLELAETHPLWVSIFAALFALIGAALISGLEKWVRDELEALIGCLYVLSATGALLLIAHDPHGMETLKKTLDGEILWVQWPDLVNHALVYGLCLGAIAYRPALLQGKIFYFMFALAITSSVQLVGIYLVFSSLIIPALAARHAPKPYLTAYSLGLVALLVGMGLSYQQDLPTSAAIVWSLAIVGLMARGLSRTWVRKGGTITA